MLLYNLSCYLKGLVTDFSVLISLFIDFCIFFISAKIKTMRSCLFGVSETAIFRNRSNLKACMLLFATNARDYCEQYNSITLILCADCCSMFVSFFFSKVATTAYCIW